MAIDPKQLEIAAADAITFPTRGTIVAAVYGEPNQKGTSSLDLTIEYPADSPDKEVFSDVLYFNEEEMALPSDQRKQLVKDGTLTKGRAGWINKGIAQVQQLAAAAESIGKTFTMSIEGSEQLVGAPIDFSATPDREDPTRLKFSTIKYLNGKA